MIAKVTHHLSAIEPHVLLSRLDTNLSHHPASHKLAEYISSSSYSAATVTNSFSIAQSTNTGESEDVPYRGSSTVRAVVFACSSRVVPHVRRQSQNLDAKSLIIYQR